MRRERRAVAGHGGPDGSLGQKTLGTQSGVPRATGALREKVEEGQKEGARTGVEHIQGSGCARPRAPCTTASIEG